MKTETLEKIRNIIVTLFVFFISILIMLTVFGSLPVHAAEANSFVLNTFKGDYKYSYSNTNTASNNYRECFTGYLHFTDKKFYAFVYDTETNASFGMFRLFYYDPGSGKVKVYQLILIFIMLIKKATRSGRIMKFVHFTFNPIIRILKFHLIL